MKHSIMIVWFLWMAVEAVTATGPAPEQQKMARRGDTKREETARSQKALQRYLQMAAENNPGLKRRFNEYMAALEVVPQVRSLPDPQVAFAYFISPVQTRVGPQRLRFSASQFLPWFGTLQARESVAVHEAREKYEVFKESRSKLFNDVKSVYYNLYLNRRALDITRENIELLGSIQNLIVVKIEAGLVSMADEFRMKMEINDLENQLALLKDKHQVLEREFSNLLHSEETMKIVLPDTLWQTDLSVDRSAALDTILHANHQMLALEVRQNTLAYRKDLAERKGKPDLKIGLDYFLVGQGENNLSGRDAFVFPSVGITIPLYRNKYKAMVREVSYLEAANRQASLDKGNSLETIFDRAWKEYLDADRRIGLNREQMQLAEKTLKLLESEYATAHTDLEEILRMEHRLLKYSLEFEKARADKQAAVAFIEYLMGK